MKKKKKYRNQYKVLKYGIFKKLAFTDFYKSP